MDKNTIIGLWNDNVCSEPITFEQLKERCKAAGCKYTLEQYLDKRVSTNLTRFNYDPFTGEKVDYAVLGNPIRNNSSEEEDAVRQKLYAILETLVDSDVVIKDDLRVGYDLGLDSLDQVEAMMRIENEFNVRVPDEDYENATTVYDVIRVIVKHLDTKQHEGYSWKKHC